jgi:hypothetical protein
VWRCHSPAFIPHFLEIKNRLAVCAMEKVGCHGCEFTPHAQLGTQPLRLAVLPRRIVVGGGRAWPHHHAGQPPTSSTPCRRASLLSLNHDHSITVVPILQYTSTTRIESNGKRVWLAKNKICKRVGGAYHHSLERRDPSSSPAHKQSNSVHLTSWQALPLSRFLSATALEAHQLPAQRLCPKFRRRDRHEVHPHSFQKP